MHSTINRLWTSVLKISNETFLFLFLCLFVFVRCKQSEEAEVKETVTDNAYNLGVYYYPWYYNDFHGGHYLRELLVPSQYPELGPYNDRNSDVINQHLVWSREAGIDFWVTSWWGPQGREDITTLNYILKHPNLGSLKIALFYETTGRTNEFTSYTNLGPDMAYIASHYFSHPNYLRIEDKPVLFIYLTRVLSDRGELQSSITTLRYAASTAGFELYLIGDQVFGSAPSSIGDIALLDAITNYDVYGSMGAHGYATQTAVDAYYQAQARWKQLAQSVNVAFVPATTPGFNDKGVRDGHPPVSRQLTSNHAFGSLFRAMLLQAKDLVDAPLGNMLMVTSWNEWHEDTQIEPVAAAEPTSQDMSLTGSAYTTGLSYEGYGDRYLEILKEVLVTEP
jgi:glycoprotein endo-alpha-1,2-mannosidase